MKAAGIFHNTDIAASSIHCSLKLSTISQISLLSQGFPKNPLLIQFIAGSSHKLNRYDIIFFEFFSNSLKISLTLYIALMASFLFVKGHISKSFQNILESIVILCHFLNSSSKSHFFIFFNVSSKFFHISLVLSESPTSLSFSSFVKKSGKSFLKF